MKKYLPYIVLIAAAMLFIWVKEPAGKSERPSFLFEAPIETKNGEPLKDTTHLIYNKHAKCRMDCRKLMSRK